MKTNTLRKKRKNVPLEREALSIKRHFFPPYRIFEQMETRWNSIWKSASTVYQRVALLFSSLTGQRFSFMGELEACWFNERGPCCYTLTIQRHYPTHSGTESSLVKSNRTVRNVRGINWTVQLCTINIKYPYHKFF